MKYCEHIEYTPETKTYMLGQTAFIQVATINSVVTATCEECGANVDIEPLKQGGLTLARKS